MKFFYSVQEMLRPERELPSGSFSPFPVALAAGKKASRMEAMHNRANDLCFELYVGKSVALWA